MSVSSASEAVKRNDEWKWSKNPFKGTNELQGLKILMAFLNKDMKNSNNVVLETGGERQYVISDLGVSFGKTGSNNLPLFWRIGRSRNNRRITQSHSSSPALNATAACVSISTAKTIRNSAA